MDKDICNLRVVYPLILFKGLIDNSVQQGGFRDRQGVELVGYALVPR